MTTTTTTKSAKRKASKSELKKSKGSPNKKVARDNVKIAPIGQGAGSRVERESETTTVQKKGTPSRYRHSMIVEVVIECDPSSGVFKQSKSSEDKPSMKQSTDKVSKVPMNVSTVKKQGQDTTSTTINVEASTNQDICDKTIEIDSLIDDQNHIFSTSARESGNNQPVTQRKSRWFGILFPQDMCESKQPRSKADIASMLFFSGFQRNHFRIYPIVDHIDRFMISFSTKHYPEMEEREVCVIHGGQFDLYGMPLQTFLLKRYSQDMGVPTLQVGYYRDAWKENHTNMKGEVEKDEEKDARDEEQDDEEMIEIFDEAANEESAKEEDSLPPNTPTSHTISKVTFADAINIFCENHSIPSHSQLAPRRPASKKSKVCRPFEDHCCAVMTSRPY